MSKGLVGGGHLSRGEHAQALQHVVPAVASLPDDSRSEGGLGHGQRGLQREVAAVAGGVVTARLCACRRAVHYTVIQHLNYDTVFPLPEITLGLFYVIFGVILSKCPLECKNLMCSILCQGLHYSFPTVPMDSTISLLPFTSNCVRLYK